MLLFIQRKNKWLKSVLKKSLTKKTISMSIARLSIRDCSGLLKGTSSIETKATNGLQLAEDIIKSSGNKELKASDITILREGKPIEISENINITALCKECCLIIVRNV